MAVSRTIHPTDTQPAPCCDTHPRAAVWEWQCSGTLIPRSVAQMLASWWQAPGNAFSAFSHTGAVTDDLAREIGAALRYARARVSTADQVAPLLALSAYVGACTVSPYIVTHNAPGCLPDGDPYAHTLDYGDARQAWVDMMGEAAEILAGDDCECAGFSDGDGTCPPCDVDAHARACVRDAAPPWDEPTGAGPWDHAVTLAPDDEPTHARVFVIGRTPMRADDFFAGTGTPLPAPDAALAGTGTAVAGAA